MEEPLPVDPGSRFLTIAETIRNARLRRLRQMALLTQPEAVQPLGEISQGASGG